LKKDDPTPDPEATPMHFPYMFWAHNEMAASTWSLSTSGMPVPDAKLLGPEELPPDLATAANLDHPGHLAMPAFEAAIAERYGVDPSRIVLTMGASAALHLVATTYFRDGARVAVDVPSYQPFRALPPYFGASLCEVERREHEDWRLDPGDVAAALDAPGTPQTGPAHVFFTNPNNPTGALSSAELLHELGTIAGDRGGILICNESYMDLVPVADQVRCATTIPRSITIGSLTKPYGMGALRLGWLVLGEDMAGERTRLLDHLYMGYVDPPTPAIRIGLRAVKRLDDLRAPYNNFAAECRPLLYRWAQEMPGVNAFCSGLGLTIFARIENLDATGATQSGPTDTMAFSKFAAEHFDLAVTPGEFFGVPGCLRLGFGTPREHLEGALQQLTKALEAWRTK
jgi:aspartate/methionine/tyrosine aminotransferase